MLFQHSEKINTLIQQLRHFMDQHIYPLEQEYPSLIEKQASRWQTPEIIQQLKQQAKADGLWNLFLPDEKYGAGLNNYDYAPLAEMMGRVHWCSEVFNCSAPDTGNMELLAHYGSEAQKEQWLQPLLRGEIRSGFAMTEPDVASSDATNIECAITADGEDYIINGRKWFTTGAMNESCKLLILMGKTDPDNPSRHLQQSQILIPMDTEGVSIIRPLTCFGYDDAPVGHAEILFDNVRVPKTNIILGEGRGFEIAQGRLGPGRIHHCMRLIGLAQRALEAMCQRADTRIAFGKPLSQQGSVREDIALSACDIEQARLLVFQAAAAMDKLGNKGAKHLIAQIKIVVPRMACTVIDRAIQLHGGAGMTEDFFLANAYNYARAIRLADGPDQVHMAQLGKGLIAQYANMDTAS